MSLLFHDWKMRILCKRDRACERMCECMSLRWTFDFSTLMALYTFTMVFKQVYVSQYVCSAFYLPGACVVHSNKMTFEKFYLIFCFVRRIAIFCQNWSWIFMNNVNIKWEVKYCTLTDISAAKMRNDVTKLILSICQYLARTKI